jgi:hypothetical protein
LLKTAFGEVSPDSTPPKQYYFRIGDKPPGTQKTDDTELGERIGLFPPVETPWRRRW